MKEIRCNIDRCSRIAIKVCNKCHIDLCYAHSQCPSCELRYRELLDKIYDYQREHPVSYFLLEEPLFADLSLPYLLSYALYAFWVVYFYYCMIHYSTLADSLIVSAMGILSSKLVFFIAGETIRLKLTSFDEY